MAEKEIYRLEVNVGVTGDDKTKKKLSAMDKYVEKTEKRMKRLDRMEASPAAKLQDKITSPLKKIEGRIGSFAKNAIKKFTAVAAAGALIVGGLGIKDTMTTFMDFEQGLSNVQAVSQATAEELAILRDEAKRLGAETAWSAVQVTEAQTLLAQAGFTVQETIAALPGLLDMASAEGMDLADATDIAAGTLRAFGLAAEEATHVADVLALSATATNSDIAGLGEAMKYVGPAANALGVDLEQTAAAIGMLSNANIKGSQAGTTLRAALTRLAKPSKEAADLMRSLGFNAFDSSGRMLPLHEVIANLQKSTAGLTEQQRANAMATIFGQEAMSGMLALVEQGPEALKELTDSLYTADGAAKQMAETKLDNLAGAITILQSAVEGMKIELGERLAPYARQFVDWLTPKIPIITDKIVELVDRAQEFATRAYPAVLKFIDVLKTISPLLPGIAATIATIKIGNKIQSGIRAFTEFKGLLSQTITGAGGIGKAMGLLIGPVGKVALIVGALVTVGVLLWKNWDKIKEKATQLGNWISEKWNGIKEATANTWENVKTTVSDKWNSLKETVLGIGPAIREGISNTWENIKTGAIDKWNSIKEGVANAARGVKNYLLFNFLSLPDPIFNAINTIKEGILTAFEGIKNILSGAWKVIKNIFMGALLVIIDIVTLDFESLKKDIAGIWNNIKDGFSQIWEGIKQVFIGAGEAIKGYLTFLWESLKNGILTIWTTVTNFLSTTWENIKAGAIEGWNSFKEGVANVITGAVEWIKETWNNTVEWFSTLPSRLYEKGVEMFNSLKDGIAEMKDTVVSKVKEVGTGIIEKAKELPGEMLQIGKDIMSGLVDGIKSMITAPVRAIKGAAEKIADGIRNKLKIKSPSRVMIEYGEFTTEGLAKGIEERIPKLEAVVGTIYEVINKVHELKDSFLNFIQPIISTVLPVIQNVGSAFMGVVNAVIPFVMARLELLMGVFKVLWTNVLQPIATYIAGVFSDVIQTAFTVIGSVVTTVVETISGILSGLSSILSGIADFIVGIFTGNWEQAWEGIKGITSGAIEVVKSIFSGLFDFLKDIPGHMLEIGKNIMKGLANGIKTAISIPVNAIKNVGKSIVDGVKGALKIKSPSRVMIEYGEFTTEGLAKGIEERIPKLEAVVGTTYEVITKEEAKENKITRTPILQQAYEKIKSFRPFYPVFEPDDPEGGNKPIPRVALAGAGGGTTYNIYIDDIDVNVSGTGDGSNEDIYEIVEQAQEEFGRKLLEALKDKK